MEVQRQCSVIHTDRALLYKHMYTYKYVYKMYIFISCIRICMYTFSSLYKYIHLVYVFVYICLQRRYIYLVFVFVCIHMFIQKSSVCMDQYICMRALCKEVQKKGSVRYICLYIIYISTYIYVYRWCACLYICA